MRTSPFFLALTLTVASAVPTSAQTASPTGPASRWVTLGTNGGPIAIPGRSEPANALRIGNTTIIVDAGDGTAEQLAKAGIPLASVKAVVISHLHFDHTAGLLAILGLRWQTNVGAPLAIYGPPGTKKLLDGLLAAMEPTVLSGYGLVDAPIRPATSGITTTEIRDGATFVLEGAKVTAAKNTHYSFVPGSADDRAFESLSFRFDLADRSIVYSGDTGPSAKLARLAEGADLLVSEMIDADRTMAELRRTMTGAPPAVVAATEAHLRAHHLTPDEVGKLARSARVKAVVVTHFVSPGADGATQLGYLAAIARSFAGPVVIASDLQGY